MSTLSLSVEVDVPRDRLFTHVATDWESGTALGVAETGGGQTPRGRMGPGFRLQCAGGRWALSEDTWLEVVGYRLPERWRAVSRSGPALSWEIRVAPTGQGARLTCVVVYRPGGLLAELRDVIWRRGPRRAALRELLEEWRRGAERTDALRRLRAASRPAPTGHPGSGLSLEDHPAG